MLVRWTRRVQSLLLLRLYTRTTDKRAQFNARFNQPVGQLGPFTLQCQSKFQCKTPLRYLSRALQRLPVL